jgi:hypothetical protein
MADFAFGSLEVSPTQKEKLATKRGSRIITRTLFKDMKFSGKGWQWITRHPKTMNLVQKV